MIIAVGVAVTVLALFVLISFIATCKNYSFEVEGRVVKVQNIGAHLKIFIDGVLSNDEFAPQLIAGVDYNLRLNDKDVVLHCKSSKLGYKLRVEVEADGKIIADNGVTIKEKTSKKKQG